MINWLRGRRFADEVLISIVDVFVVFRLEGMVMMMLSM
jgi:hypothetical protein